jgi:hypothetical protein
LVTDFEALREQAEREEKAAKELPPLKLATFKGVHRRGSSAGVTPDSAMTLEEQIRAMVDDGAVLIWHRYGIQEFLGWVVVEEAEKRLFFMRIWPEGTGSVHILRWDRVAREADRVLFYREDGHLKGVITRMREFPEFDQKQLPLDIAEWKREFRKHEADYMRFLRSEMEVLKDAQDLDWP